MLVKICGITRLEDALAAARAGADLLGFNFYSGSPRHVPVPTAARIREQLPQSVQAVGVFVNEPEPQTVVRAAQAAGLDMVQLHGDETPEYCAALSGLRVIKAFRLRPGLDASALRRYRVYAILLDAFRPGQYGGTGSTADWELARRLGRGERTMLLGGGLMPENVAEAIRRVRPQGVDVAGGVESAPGRKDHERLQAFVEAARAAAAAPAEEHS